MSMKTKCQCDRGKRALTFRLTRIPQTAMHHQRVGLALCGVLALALWIARSESLAQTYTITDLGALEPADIKQLWPGRRLGVSLDAIEPKRTDRRSH